MFCYYFYVYGIRIWDTYDSVSDQHPSLPKSELTSEHTKLKDRLLHLKKGRFDCSAIQVPRYPREGGRRTTQTTPWLCEPNQIRHRHQNEYSGLNVHREHKIIKPRIHECVKWFVFRVGWMRNHFQVNGLDLTKLTLLTKLQVCRLDTEDCDRSATSSNYR